MKYIRIFFVVGAIAAIFLSGSAFGWFLRIRQEYLDLRLYEGEHPTRFSWKTYNDPINGKFSVAYPSFLKPSSEDNAVYFPSEFYVTYSAWDSSFADNPEYKTLMENPTGNVSDFFVEYITIDGYKAGVYKFRYFDGSVMDGSIIILLTEHMRYVININSAYSKEILASFKVL